MREDSPAKLAISNAQSEELSMKKGDGYQLLVSPTRFNRQDDQVKSPDKTTAKKRLS